MNVSITRGQRRQKLHQKFEQRKFNKQNYEVGMRDLLLGAVRKPGERKRRVGRDCCPRAPLRPQPRHPLGGAAGRDAGGTLLALVPARLGAKSPVGCQRLTGEPPWGVSKETGNLEGVPMSLPHTAGGALPGRPGPGARGKAPWAQAGNALPLRVNHWGPIGYRNHTVI